MCFPVASAQTASLEKEFGQCSCEDAVAEGPFELSRENYEGDEQEKFGRSECGGRGETFEISAYSGPP